jgi:hypothetical protein
MRRVSLAACLLLAWPAWSQEGALRLRGGEAVPAGATVTAVDEQGVLVTQEGGAARVYSWDRVESVAADRWPNAARYAAVGDRAWRARTRLERGDAVGAEDLLDELFGVYESRRGATSAVVALGVLRCRLSRGALTPAVPALLSLVASGGPPADWARASRAEQDAADVPPDLVYDDAMGLSPLLAPVWLRTPAVAALAHAEWPRSSDSTDRASRLSRLYECSAKFEAGMPADLGARPTGDDGLELVFDVVASRAGDATQRGEARRALRERLAKSPTAWVAVWCRAALGRSMLLEQGPDARLLAVAELLRVPATAERVQPYLTGVCLAEAAVALAAEGSPQDASRLRDELAERFPQHPALPWDALNALGRTRPTLPARRAAPDAFTLPDASTTPEQHGGSP